MRPSKRHFKRYPVHDIYALLQDGRRLTVCNMSLTGMAAEAAFPLRIGETYSIRIGDDVRSIEIPAEVKWSQLVGIRFADSEAENVYQVGIDFTQALDGNAQDILDLLEGHIVVKLDQGLPGQFRAHDAPVELDLRLDFQVKAISFSGMVVETDTTAPFPLDQSLLDVELRDDKLPLECAARVRQVHPLSQPGELCEVDLEFQNLSIDDSLALGKFIRGALE